MRRIFLAALCLLLAGCAALSPEPRSTGQRLDSFPTENLPLRGEVEILWDEHQIPYIIAEKDRDAAFALGLVHAHLRWGQLALFKRLSQGRLSEMLGPPAERFDKLLRRIGYDRASAEIVRRWPEETRVWMESFVAGLNHYAATAAEEPPEFGLLGIEPEPFTCEDLVTMSRVGGTDITWLMWAEMLPLRGGGEWPEAWGKALASGGGPDKRVAARAEARDALPGLLAALSRSGSNSLAVGPGRSASGAPVMASDPHLGLSLPNFWLICGLKSPSIQAVGLMPPGLPIFALGRNPYMAWGGTNLHASVSDLYAVDETELSSRPERLKTRFWFDEEFALRESALGPVLSDSEAFRDGAGETLALRWTGHRPTDEITALLRANRAATPEAFRQAFAGYGSPPMHMLYAHVSGEIGAFPAMLLPEREPMVPRDLVRDPDDPGAMWSGFKGTTEFAWLRDPERGYVVSANTPLDYVQDELGYAFAPPDRARRLAELVEAGGELDAGGVAAIQRDVASASAEKLAAMLAEELRRSGADGKLADTLAAWDGRYDVESRGAAAFEAALSPLLDGLYGEEPGYRSEWNYLRVFLADDLRALPDAERDDLLRGVAEKARASLADHPDWGSMHRLRVGHILKGLPVLGRFFVLGEEPYPGSRETIFKASHGPSRSVVHPTYGAQSRHISDLSDPDANRFVLMGGQDGWLGSADFDGQVPLWLRGEYVTVPLTEAGAREAFTAGRMELRGGR